MVEIPLAKVLPSNAGQYDLRLRLSMTLREDTTWAEAGYEVVSDS